MRNVFDQYSQPENRVTHALMTALNEDRNLLSEFLEEIAGRSPPTNTDPLLVTEQSYPGSVESNEMGKEKLGIPDAWITAGDDWCLVIENKVLSTPSTDQLHRHLATARRLGFTTPKLLLLTADRSSKNLPKGVKTIRWATVYEWLQGRLSRSKWAGRLAAYLEVMEARLTDLEQMESGTLTAFNGFRFGEDKTFNELEGKRILRLAMEELRKRTDLPSEIDINPKLPGKKAITGTWDILPFSSSEGARRFNHRPHCNLHIGSSAVSAMVILPNNARPSLRRLISLGEMSFFNMVDEVLENMLPLLSTWVGMEPRMVVSQRHWRVRSGPPIYDANIEMDLRTHSDDGDAVKFQPQWVDSVFNVLKNKNSNLELQIGAKFPYSRCKAIRESDALDLVAATWIACKPYISALGVL